MMPQNQSNKSLTKIIMYLNHGEYVTEESFVNEQHDNGDD